MESHDRDQFDDLVDRALEHYASAEPREGLEGRVLASLAAAERRRHRRSRWAWVLAVAGSVCVAIVVVILIGTGRLREQPIAVRRPSGAANDRVAHEASAGHSKPLPKVARHLNTRPELAKVRRPSEFPSPHPLSEQERLLKSYVRNFPQEAALVAREQAEREKELTAMGWNNTVIRDSN